MLDPRNGSKKRHGSAHAHVGDNLTVILKLKGYHTVEYGKNDGKQLSKHVPFGHEDERSYANQRGDHRQNILLRGE